jgi:hypothetical protein
VNREEKVLKEALAYQDFSIQDIGGPKDEQSGHSTSKVLKR